MDRNDADCGRLGARLPSLRTGDPYATLLPDKGPE